MSPMERDPERRLSEDQYPPERLSLRQAVDLEGAVRAGKLDVVRRLVSRGASVNAPVKDEKYDGYLTLLGLASTLPPSEVQIEIIELLLESNSNIDGRGSYGDTPLILSCWTKNVPVAKLLMKRKADVTPEGKNQLTALGNATSLPKEMCKDVTMAPLRAAQLMNLLIHAKAALEKETRPSIEQAVETNNILGVQVLIENGAPVPKSPGLLHTMLSKVPINSSAEMCRLLLCSLADVHARNAEKQIPLEVCAEEFGMGVDVYGILRRTYVEFRSRFNLNDELVDRASELDQEAMARVRRISLYPDSDRLPPPTLAEDSPRSSEDSDDHQAPRRVFHRAPSFMRRRPLGALTRLRWIQGLCRRVNRDTRFQLCMLFVLLMALFLPDIWVLTESNPKDLDYILIIVILAFVFEFYVQFYGLRCYSWSFFFYMDILGAVSVILDFKFFQDALSGETDEGGSNQMVLMRTARLAKLGARAGRFSKLVKLLRFLPGMQNTEEATSTAKGISAHLNQAVSTRVAVLIIIMVLVIPAFSMFTMLYPEQDLSLEAWNTNLLWNYVQKGELQFEEALYEFEQFFVRLEVKYFPYRVFIELPDNSRKEYFFVSPNPAPARVEDLIVRSSTLENHSIIVRYNFAAPIKIDAGMNIGMISCVMVLLMGFSMLLANVAAELVLRPLESLLHQVHTMASTIYSSVTDMSTTLKEEQEEEKKGNHMDDEDFDGETALGAETVILEKVVRKLAILSEITMQKATIDAETMAQLDPGTQAESMSQDGSSESDDDGSSEEFLANQRVQLASAGVNLNVVQSWDFNPHDLDWHQLGAVGIWMFYGDLATSQWIHNVLQVEYSQLQNFIEAIARSYIPTNPYHSWIHAMDVCHSVFHQMRACRAETYLNTAERFSMIVAAMSHDIGHPGYNNPFLVETSHELALRYNDKSPLENMHCARLFAMAVQEEETAILRRLPKAVYSEVRRVCVEAIFHTDMVYHFAMVKEIQMLYEVNSVGVQVGWDADCWTEEEWDIPRGMCSMFKQQDNRKLIRNMLLHISDISNSMKPFIICRQWAFCVLDEFFLQGDQEKELEIPVQILNDRDKVNRPFSQIGFIEFIVSPLVFAAVRVLPPMALGAEQMVLNAQQWYAEWLEITETTPELENAVEERLTNIEQAFTECTSIGK
eukprot:GEMP01002012.1.p1 GENE.GEMP01002012.1~~GEMP01002012.1.p1  ORF type:complete len:1164 (+),score=223.37 GEMP01002012.1:126-3617(+)